MSCFRRTCCCKKAEAPPKILYVFDFDFTIVSKNSETIYKGVVAKNLGIPEHEVPEPPPPIKWEHISEGLAGYVFHDCHIMLKDILAVVDNEVKFVPGMSTVLQELRDRVLRQNYNAQLLILSGSNDLFIRTKLGSIHVFPDDIISNHAILSADGQSFEYQTHSNQTDCKLCNRALCKGTELEKYFETNGRFAEVHFICDGTNDLCPSLRLRDVDTVYIRSGFGLDFALRKAVANGKPYRIQARIVYWSDGFDLQRKLLPYPLEPHSQGTSSHNICSKTSSNAE